MKLRTSKQLSFCADQWGSITAVIHFKINFEDDILCALAMYSFIWDLLYQKRKEKFDMKTQVSFWFFLPENLAKKTLKIVSLFCANKLNFCRKKGKQGGGQFILKYSANKTIHIFLLHHKNISHFWGEILFEKGKDVRVFMTIYDN